MTLAHTTLALALQLRLDGAGSESDDDAQFETIAAWLRSGRRLHLGGSVPFSG